MKSLALLFSGFLLCSGFSDEIFTYKGTEKVLDIACGTGKTAREIARVVEQGSVIGIDFSKKVIDEAKKRNLQGPSNLSFKLKDIDHWDYNSEFDVITCDSPQQFIFNQEKLLKNIYALLKPEGHIIVKVPTKIPLALESALRVVTTSEKWSDLFITFHPKWNIFGKAEYSDLLRHNHFSLVATKAIPTEEIFSSVELFKEFIKGWLPYYQIVPKDLQKEFLEELTNRYLAILPLDAEGKVHFFVQKLEVVAKKINPKESVHG